MSPELSIVIPAYNEEDNLGPLIREIREVMAADTVCEIVCVDDCSSDRTRAVVEAEAALPGTPVRLVSHTERSGQSQALVSGVRAARGEWIATLDGDGQNPPGEIPRLYALLRDAWAEDPAVVCVAGIRQGRHDTAWRRFSSRVANTVRMFLLQDGISDTGCGLKVFRRDAFLALPLFDHIHRFLPAMFQAAGGKVIGAEVSHRPRMAGESKYGTWDRLRVGIADLIGVSWLRRRLLK
ncbi:MAG: glycosyltransferase family 2 protein [Gammaproteobacteria bacterium]|nr:MAG: glycosyltransferase family 2 protein [Gammaproteobacteria bacterium]